MHSRDAEIAQVDFVREMKEPCKMTYSRMVLVKRGLLAKITNAKSQ